MCTVVFRPVADLGKPFKALLFDSQYDRYRGAVANIAVLDGMVCKGKNLWLYCDNMYIYLVMSYLNLSCITIKVTTCLLGHSLGFYS